MCALQGLLRVHKSMETLLQKILTTFLSFIKNHTVLEPSYNSLVIFIAEQLQFSK